MGENTTISFVRDSLIEAESEREGVLGDKDKVTRIQGMLA